MQEKKIEPETEPQERPIVERPELMFMCPIDEGPRCYAAADLATYIKVLEDELHQAKAIIEGLTAERDRAEAEVKRLSTLVVDRLSDTII